MPWITSAQTPFTYESGAELFSAGDFNGDGRADLLLVDRASGDYRLGLQQSDGSVIWNVPRASGADAITGLAVGRFSNSVQDAFAVTAPELNRVSLVRAGSLAPEPAEVALPGPQLLVALDIGGAGNVVGDDLLVASGLGGRGPLNDLEALRVTGIGAAPLPFKEPLDSIVSQGNRVRATTSSPWLAGLMATAPDGATEFRAFDMTTGGPRLGLTAGGLPAGASYVFGNFDGSGRSQFAFFTPDRPELLVRAVRSSADVTLGPAMAIVASGRIQQIVVIETGVRPQLLMLLDGGVRAELCDFDGAALSVRERFTAPDGEAFTAAGALGGGHLLLTSGAPGGPSRRVQRYDAATRQLSTPQDLPPLNPLRTRANLLLFAREPFVALEPGFLAALTAPDWTRDLNRLPGIGESLLVPAEQFRGAVAGLGDASTVELGRVPVGAAFALVNQYAPAISVFSFAPGAKAGVGDVSFSPLPGTQPTNDVRGIGASASVTVRLMASAPDLSVFYRVGLTGAWLPYRGPVLLTNSATVFAYARSENPPLLTPIRHATYLLDEAPRPSPAPSDDLDGNGLGDAWEVYFGLRDPNADADGDGASNLAEHNVGTDPLDGGGVRTPPTEPPPQPPPLAAIRGDFNGDGRADILFQDDDGFLSVWFMNGQDLLTATLLNPNQTGDPGYRIVATGDFNADGKEDLLFQHTDGTLAVWSMNGANLESAALLNPSDPGDPEWRVVAVGDFDKDRKPDLLFQHTGGTLAVWFMDGITMRSAAYTIPDSPGPEWLVTGVSDFNADGAADLVFQHLDGTLASWTMDGITSLQSAYFNPPHPGAEEWRVVGATDRNQDGKSDLLFQHRGDGALAVWFLDGLTLQGAGLMNPSQPGATWKVPGR